MNKKILCILMAISIFCSSMMVYAESDSFLAETNADLIEEENLIDIDDEILGGFNPSITEVTSTSSARFQEMLTAMGSQSLSGVQKNKVNYMLYNSQYRPKAFGGSNFPYLNGGSAAYNGAKGCYAYCNYVSDYVYGVSIKGTSEPEGESAGRVTAAGIKNFLKKNAQAGEHLRIDNTHSVTFLSCTETGFYYTNYLNDNKPWISLYYVTYENFANACNAISKTVFIYNVNTAANTNTGVIDPNIKMSDLSITNITDNGARIETQLNDWYAMSECGFYIRVKDTGPWILGKQEFPSGKGQKIWYDISTDYMPLNKGTAYSVYIYAIINGVKYWTSSQSFTTTGDNEAPQFGSVSVLPTEKGFWVLCYVTDNVGVTKVVFPAWTEKNGQDDLPQNWEENTRGFCSLENGLERWNYFVNIADHNYESGKYFTHIYAYDAAGNQNIYHLEYAFYPLESISLNTGSKQMKQGESYQLSVNYNPVNTTSDKSVVWTTSNASVAEVNEGKVTAKLAGTAIITATAAGKTAACTVTVTDNSSMPTPTVKPSAIPTVRPTTAPTVKPTAVPTAKPTKNWPFIDVAVKAGNWKYDNIKYVYENGIMTGVKVTEFQPDAPLTRAMFATVIYRMAGSPQVTYKNIFSDVPAGKWYSDAIIWAYEKGVVAGLGGGRFGINENITREQMARMLMEYANVQGYSTTERADFGKFADAFQVSRWATDNMRWAVGSGIISGSTSGGKYYMNPKGQATRAECATMLTRFMQKY